MSNFSLGLIFIIGLLFGSFASVIIYRLQRGEKGIIFGRSKCPQCKIALKPIDLIPLVSYVSTNGKCRYCKKSISKTYPLLELTMGFSFLITAYLSQNIEIGLLVFYLFITFVFVAVAFYDILFQEIPDSLLLPTILITAFVMYLSGIYSIESLLIGFLIPVIFFGFLFFVSHGQWLGGGDIRIGALMGLLLGWPNIITGLFLGYLIGSVWSAGGMLIKKLTRKSHIPFAPFLLFGTYITLFWGSQILNWYLSLVKVG